MQKVERLANLVALLLETRHPLTLDQVAELVPGYDATGESLRRMFERDKDELRSLGIPVELRPTDAWGAEEGYVIDPKAYRMPPLDLTEDERAALGLAARAWSSGQGDAAAVAGVAKLDLDPMGTPTSVGADLGGASPAIRELLEAVVARKRVTFTYRPPGREPSERRVDPYALVHRRGAWYVVGHDADRGDRRSFRVSRVESDVRPVRPAAKGHDFEVPHQFDPGLRLPAAGESEAREDAIVRVDAATAKLAVARGATPVDGPAADDTNDGAEQGSVCIRMTIEDRDGFVAWALGNRAEVLSPPAVRDDVARRLRDLLAVLEPAGEGA